MAKIVLARERRAKQLATDTGKKASEPIPDEQPKKLSAHDAMRVVHRLAQDSKRVFVSPHAKKKEVKHRISRRQVHTCLQKGRVTEGPFINKYGNWQVNVSRLAAGEEITCTVAIEWAKQLIVVTVYPG